LRENEKEYQRRQVQPVIVMAQQPFQLKKPKVYVKVNEDEWASWNGGGWPKSVPAEVLFDPLSTVSATYGVAFQTQFRDGKNVWSSRPAIFVIDRDGVLRHVESRGEDIREDGIFPIVDDGDEQRRLIAALEAKADTREAVRIALGPIGEQTKTAIPTLVKALKDDDAPARAGAAAALYWIATQAGTAIPALGEALQDRDIRVRRLSALALARLGPDAQSAVPALVEAVKDKESRVRSAAVNALASIGPSAKAATPALIEVLKDRDKSARARAAEALKKIDPEAAKKAGVK
jgi:HEAT repeat protein